MEFLAFASFVILVAAWMVAPSSSTAVKVSTKLEAEAA
jgi:hypothetical protein